MSHKQGIVMAGATGAVGTEVVRALEKLKRPPFRLTMLNRRPFGEGLPDFAVDQLVDVSEPTTYRNFMKGHLCAICTLGVGQPTKVSKEDFIRIDKDLVMKFATSYKEAGIEHFQLLASVGANSRSSSFYLRIKGELEDGLRSLEFKRLSLFHPSMILTPTNRYGLMQGLTLAVWPMLNPLLMGGLRKFRGVPVEHLGKAIANNVFVDRSGEEVLDWDDFQRLQTIAGV